MILLQPWCLHVSNICVFTAPKTFTLSSYSQDIWIWLLSSTLCLPINQYPRIPQFFVFLAILVSFKWLLAGRAVNIAGILGCSPCWRKKSAREAYRWEKQHKKQALPIHSFYLDIYLNLEKLLSLGKCKALLRIKKDK